MKHSNSLKDISLLINKLNKDWGRFSDEKNNPSRIDRDILVDEIRMLYEVIVDLDIPKYKPSPVIDPAQQETAIDEPEQVIQKKAISKDIISEEENEKDKEPEKVHPAESVEKEPTVERVSAQSENELADIQPEQINKIPGLEVKNEPAFIEPETSKVQQKPRNGSAEQKTTLDLFTANKTLADTFLNEQDNSVATKMQKNHVEDIKSIIGINDKFLFINEIFSGEMLSYQQAIDQLNRFLRYHEALQYLDNLKLKHGNEENKTAFTKLMEITKRKYN